MDRNKQLDGFTLNFNCDFNCGSCKQKTRCFVWTCEQAGKKLGPSEELGDQDYEKLVTIIKENLNNTIGLIRGSANGLTDRTGPDTASMKTGRTKLSHPGNLRNPNLERIIILQLSREFTNQAYNLLKSIRVRETIPLKVLISLRELQWHHTLVTTKLCRSVAGLTENSTVKRTKVTANAAKQARDSLERCRTALLEIVSVLPDEKKRVTGLLDLSEQIAHEIKVHLL